MPNSSHLPPDISAITERQAIVVRSQRDEFHADMRRVAEGIMRQVPTIYVDLQDTALSRNICPVHHSSTNIQKAASVIEMENQLSRKVIINRPSTPPPPPALLSLEGVQMYYSQDSLNKRSARVSQLIEEIKKQNKEITPEMRDSATQIAKKEIPSIFDKYPPLPDGLGVVSLGCGVLLLFFGATYVVITQSLIYKIIASVVFLGILFASIKLGGRMESADDKQRKSILDEIQSQLKEELERYNQCQLDILDFKDLK